VHERNWGILGSRGNGANGQPCLVQNLDVENNSINETVGIAAGIVKQVVFDKSVYTDWNNHFQDNTFTLSRPASYDYFFWLGEPWTQATWDNYANLH
jgi:hypothetical protein